MLRILRTAAFLAAAGCGADRIAEHATPALAIRASRVAANPHNVLSAIVIARVRGTDSVAVHYRVAGQELTRVTAAVVTLSDPAIIPVLGLLPETAYTLNVMAYGAGPPVAGQTLRFVTGPLPADLPRYSAWGADPTPGFVVIAAGAYGLVIDNSGRVVWYRRFAGGVGLNFQAQPTGRYVARPPPPAPARPAPWVELDPLGNVTRTLDCTGGLEPRFHDLLSEPDGAYWILCDEARVMDLSAAGGVADARVIGTAVQHIDAAGRLRFQWSPFDHFPVTDLDLAERSGPLVNWTHGNALDLDADGNLLVSFRNLSEITKIDTRTGAVLWRMGGVRNEFTFDDNTAPRFARQHGVRGTGPGQLLFLDNLGNPAESRAVRYAYDAAARSARRLGSLGSDPPVTAQLGGTAQDLPAGRALVSFGSAGRVEEYDAAGHVVWRIDTPGYVFRAQRIISLYRPGVGAPR